MLDISLQAYTQGIITWFRVVNILDSVFEDSRQ